MTAAVLFDAGQLLELPVGVASLELAVGEVPHDVGCLQEGGRLLRGSSFRSCR